MAQPPKFKRYAVYYTLPEGPLSDVLDSWLGWSINHGCNVAHPVLSDLPQPIDAITKTPRRYGFHATLKPPFTLNKDTTLRALETDLQTFANAHPPVALTGLEIVPLGRFLALVPSDENPALTACAARVVRDLDRHRAAPSEAELQKRRAKGLSPAQEHNLTQWGYPYVCDEFRFHMTLTSRLPKSKIEQTRRILGAQLSGFLPQPFTIDALSLCAEDDTGHFHLLSRHSLNG